MIKYRLKKGFTLVEIALVLSIAAIAGFVAFSQIVRGQELMKAQFAGSQIKQLGEAVNAYISNHYDTLSTLTNSTGSSSDVGPRTCVTSTNLCTITTTTLTNEGLLPSSYSGKNVYGSGYNILLKRTGTSPYYKINGMIATDTSLKIGNNIRYDLLGQAMQIAGIDSGMTRDSSSVVSGFNGSWSENYTNYSNISKLGLLAYQAGYGTYNYSVFLRRDGTLPMTGNLNMGSNSILNSVDYTGSGNINTGGTITAGSEITAENGYGDTITLGGDGAGSDYELRLGTAKPLSIFSPNLPSVDRATTTVFKTNGQSQILGNLLVNNSIATNGYLPTDMPAGWSGIRTADLVGSGTLAVLKNGTTGAANDKAFYATQYGNMYASNSITSGNWIWATNGYGNQVGFGGDSGGNDYEIKMMTDEPLSIHMNSNRSDLTALKVTGGIYATGNIQTTGNLQFLNSVVYGDSCPTKGIVSRDDKGTILSCINGVWQYQTSIVEYVQFDGSSLPASASYVGCATAVPYSKFKSITFTSNAPEVFSTSFNVAGGNNTDSEVTACIFVDNVFCAAQSRIMGNTSGNASCIKELAKGNHTVTYVAGYNYSVGRFIAQYSRQIK